MYQSGCRLREVGLGLRREELGRKLLLQQREWCLAGAVVGLGLWREELGMKLLLQRPLLLQQREWCVAGAVVWLQGEGKGQRPPLQLMAQWAPLVPLRLRLQPQGYQGLWQCQVRWLPFLRLPLQPLGGPLQPCGQATNGLQAAPPLK